ncbi:MAG: beta-lactamase family protein [Clostridia bacterium]|nr:beta-lactamase family protein [Clostridia bacterium]
MFVRATPESAGVSSRQILKYLKMIDSHGLASHSVLIARGDKLICEAYWKPFDSSVKHRMYSQTKSYVGIAVRLLAEEGRLSLDDKIISYFPDKLPETVHPYLEKLTVRNMLMMRTCFDEYDINWFRSGTDDRVKLYFSQKPAVYPGTQYRYDSMGSFVLGALVERLSGKPFLDYLREKCLDEIGFSKSAYCLKCPGGHSWADSALICTPLDMLSFGRLVGCYGRWNGKQIIPENIIREALADASDCMTNGYRSFDNCGYASQLWRFYGNSFGFNGMHDQLTFYDPDTDITFTCTSGNYRTPSSRELLISYAFSEIIDTVSDSTEEDETAYNELESYIKNLKLVTAYGEKSAELEKEINGKVFIAEDNRLGITEFSFSFGDECEFRYKNEQGEKVLRFGRCENIFQPFPQTGYSDIVGGQSCEGHTYDCAASGAWGTENQLRILVQIIDVYIGTLYISFAYRDGHGRIKMIGDAENFLGEYNGTVNAVIK